MKRVSSILLIVTALLALAACQAPGNGSSFDQTNITEAGNPPTPKKVRKVVGQLPVDEDGGCTADSALSADTRFITKVATIDADCQFEFDLATGKAWSLKFSLASNESVRLFFANGSDLSAFYFLSDSNMSVDLGSISFTGNFASAQNEATAQNDRDGDGMSDFDDQDDDNDGIADADEPDCDNDGIIDDFELDLSC